MERLHEEHLVLEPDLLCGMSKIVYHNDNLAELTLAMMGLKH
jgi:hypothetical protein